MATRKKVDVAGTKTERDTKMRAAYQSAIATLKANHADEWNALLDAAYADAGLEVRRRLTDEEKAAREQAKIEAKKEKLLAQLAELGVAVLATPGTDDFPYTDA